MASKIFFYVNGRKYETCSRPQTPLIYVLRNELGLKGTRQGCGYGECGACTVLVNNIAMKSCDLPVESVQEQQVLTIEGLSQGNKLSSLQRSILDNQAGQCAYCLPGIIMTATAILTERPGRTRDEICNALTGHLCRCGAHPRIIAAIIDASANEV